MDHGATVRGTLRLDLLLYAVGVVFAAVSAAWSEFYGHRVWGNFASVGYLLALAYTGWLLLDARRSPQPRRTSIRSRWIPVGVSGVLCILVPLIVLIFVRSPTFKWGPWSYSWPAQPEVWVIERSAELFFDGGTPYQDLTALGRAPIVDDYTPYGPVMTLFGLPRALLGTSPLTDARVAFLIVSVLAVWLTVRRLGPAARSVRAAQLLAVSPLTAITLVVAGDDLPVITLIILATALVFRSSMVWAAVVAALVVSMKLTALPALAVLTVAAAAHAGRRGLAVFLGTTALTIAVVTVPVLLVNPAMFVEHVISFPAGLGDVRSPAESPLPGHLLSRLGPVGHVAALALLALAACVITAWLLLRPPRSAPDVMLRIATGLGTAILLAPATRWGYLVYPVALFGAMIAFRAAEQAAGRGQSHHSDLAHGPSGTTPVVAPDTR